MNFEYKKLYRVSYDDKDDWVVAHFIKEERGFLVFQNNGKFFRVRPTSATFKAIRSS